jgi:hypothetical protein
VRTWLLAICLAVAIPAHAQNLDRDGLADHLEQALLEKFTPTLLFAEGECAPCRGSCGLNKNHSRAPNAAAKPAVNNAGIPPVCRNTTVSPGDNSPLRT